jgi:tetratricopeptide (TPR) repeat protein
MSTYLLRQHAVRGALVIVIAIAAAACSENPDTAKREAVTRGDALFAKAQYSEAVIEYRRAIQFDARYGEAHRKLADTYLKAGDGGNAIREFVRAADLLPDDADLQITVGNFLLASGRFDDARVRAEQVLNTNPKSAAAHVLRGNALAGLKDLDGALSDMEAAIAEEPGKGITYANLGVVQHLRGDATKAEAAYTAALQADPASVPIRLSYANYLTVVNRLDDAEAQLKEAFNRDRMSPMVSRALAVFYAGTGHVDKAEPYLKRLAEDSGDIGAQFSLVQLYVGTGRRDEASRLLTALKARTDTQRDATLMLARLAYADRETARAYGLVKEVLDAAPNEPRALILKARLDLLEKKPADAIAAAKLAVSADPTLAEGSIVLGEAYRATRDLEGAKTAYNEALRLRPNDAAVQVALSQLNLATGGLDAAKQFAQSALATAPQAPLTRVTLVRAAIASGDVTAADAQLTTLLKEYPQSGTVHVLEGALALVRKDVPGAERAFKKAAELAPASIEATAGLILIELSTGRGIAARARADGLAAQSPANADALVLAARTYASLKDLPKTEELLRRAIEVDAARSEPYSMLARVYLEQGKMDQALTEFKTLAQREPKSIGTRTMVAAILQTQNKRDEAKKAYRETLLIDPTAAVAANNLAWMMTEDNSNLDDALQLVQAARAKLPDSPEVNDTLGWIYYKKGMHEQAIAAFKQSVEKQPNTATFHYHLGLAAAKAGQFTQARQALETALRLDPKNADANEAKAALSRLSAYGS